MLKASPDGEAPASFVPCEADAIDAYIDRFALRKGLACMREEAAQVSETIGTLLASTEVVTTERVLSRLGAIERDQAHLATLLLEPGIKQRTPEWYAARGQLITASDAAQALGCGKFGTQKQFFAKKCGFEKEAFNPNVPPLKWGTMYEQVATMAYERRLKCKVHEFGLLRHPEKDYLGASPDGINELGVMVEIKCPYRRKINGEVPMQYYYQIQGQLDVCSLSSCDYVECDIEEYDSWADLELDYLTSTEVTYGYGFVLEVAPKPVLFVDTDSSTHATSEYYYSQQGRSPEELRADWDALEAQLHQGLLDSANYRQGGAEVRPHRYRIKRMSIQRIAKDPAFVADMVERLGEVWQKVIAYRGDKAMYDRELKLSACAVKRAGRSTPSAVLQGADNGIALQGYSFIDD
jgi:putative phage-type endonuclease